ncbi:mitochondrial outer membrane protein porin 6 isoform X1 [Amborella trichopoda]|uniref:Mitochondrial outer membrane protein porin 6 n=2 Tax=Amborella trichopoda TaxID=13333 RepID=W1PJM2_AMBTC|nr:mitochondrial outer membrane protein porin 6 isoform X1 [Amborella trichopoda]XP_011623830.1 mitochondrial outer membrane protein porin 6 isoform X1 [Amborella trichopoda]XP_011623831.1 mitochondrial outer membrane protein porin 6 isoform X1 [Amborella trichopoda]XP_011623832.1 mitochondrial outer membrane protein porin 6 isoform X1 [Amborella trichopoda]ERN07300.1 hypothetical protein AMTR_s00019p00217910 [Amborella trichopoda]|eukprot:XP_006845625.1 mitochondrial outer membrane protein porin 6 isoform X1 [Amborella trichopoda]
MAKGPGPFSDIGKKARDLLTRDYNYDEKFTLTMLSDNGLALTTTGLKRGQFFTGDLSTQYKSGNTTVDVKVDTNCNITSTITVNEIFPSSKTALSFKIPDHKSGKLEVQYLHDRAAINSSIGLTPTPLLEFSAAVGNGEVSLGGEVAFDTATASLTKYNVGIGLTKEDYSAALMVADKGETLKASYLHTVNPVNGTAVAAEISHKLTTYENNFTIGSSHFVDPYTMVKTRFSNDGKVAMLCQRQWRPKSLMTFSAEMDPKTVSSTRFGLAVALRS